jgi:hypothetical protein
MLNVVMLTVVAPFMLASCTYGPLPRIVITRYLVNATLKVTKEHFTILTCNCNCNLRL